MINRVLIRIKVVQLLYSYLLVDNQFSIESQPDSPTRERRFAYSLYIDMLSMMVAIASDVTRRGGHSPLADTRFIRRISQDERVRMLSSRILSGNSPLSPVEKILSETVKESALYKKFLKSEDPGGLEDEKIWQQIFEIIIMNNSSLDKEFSKMENFSLSGVEKMRSMMEATFSNFYAASDHLPDALKTLAKSMDQARELYFRLLDLPVKLVALRDSDIEEQRRKFLATDSDLNPNLRFVENEFVKYLRRSEALEAGLNRYGNSMSSDDEPMLRALLNAIMASDIYQEYMEFPATDFERDCEFWKNIYRHVIFNSPDFLEAMEEKSVFWNDDLDTIGTFVVKTVRRISDHVRKAEKEREISGEVISDDLYPVNDAEVILPMYKDEEDARFGAELFSAVVNNKEQYREYLNQALDSRLWDSERMAYMDVVVILTAVAEMLNFPNIPLNVTLNEYIEIAKSYSTAKSGPFVHGMLGAIVKNLKSEGILLK